MIKMRLVIPVGPSDVAKKVIEEFRTQEKKLLQEFGKKVEHELRRRIVTQKLNVPALSSAYLREKAQRRWSLKTLVRTGGYAKAIRAKYIKGQLRIVAEGEDAISGVKYGEIARHLEFGTKRMPARPHWRPMIPWAKRAFSKYIRKWAAETVAKWSSKGWK